jgi:hypothetical protein
VDRGFDASVPCQVEVPVRGRPRIDRVAFALGQKLRAGRRGREQADIAALAVLCLMHMPPHYGADVGVGIDHAPERFRIREPHGVQPAAAH